MTLHTDLPYFIHFTLLSFTDTAFFTSWRFVATLCHFSNNVCSLYVSVSHFGNSHSISYFFFIIIFEMRKCWKDKWQFLNSSWIICHFYFIFSYYGDNERGRLCSQKVSWLAGWFVSFPGYKFIGAQIGQVTYPRSHSLQSWNPAACHAINYSCLLSTSCIITLKTTHTHICTHACSHTHSLPEQIR